MLEFRLLGPVRLVVDSRDIDLGPSKQRAILAVLLAEFDRPVSTDVLVDRVWDDPPETVRHSVYTYVARLRRILRVATAHTAAPVQIRRTFGGYQLEPAAGRIDLAEFLRLVDTARAMGAEDPGRAETLARALELWHGEPLAGVDGEWAANYRESLRQLRHEAIVERADTGLRTGDLKVVSADLRHALMENPLAEDLHERLLTAYHLDNRGAEALAHYDRMRRAFAEELGVDPGLRLRELHLRLLGEQDLEIPYPATRTVVGTAAPTTVTFTARAAELERVRKALTEDSRPVLVTGGPGMGKTALAEYVSTLVGDRFPQGVLRADLGGCSGTPADPGTVLTRLLRGLGVPEREIPADTAERSDRYRAALATRRMLIILDDAADDAQIAPLLPCGTGSSVLITSRKLVRPPGVDTVLLRELAMAESIAMLEADVGAERLRAQEWAAGALSRCCSGIPLALRAVGARLAARPHWTIVGQLGRMSDERQRLDQFVYGALDMPRSMAPSVDRLSPRAALVFRHLGATLGPREVFTTVAVPGLAGTTGTDALDELVDAHLLTVAEHSAGNSPQFVMLEIHRLYAKHLTAAAAAETAEPLLA